MHAQLEVARKLVLPGGVSDHGQVVVEFLLELREVANVIHAFVEAAGELRRNGLDGDLLIGDGRQNDEQLGRSLRRVGLVHGNFRDEMVRAFALRDVAIDAPGFLDGEEILGGNGLDRLARGGKRRGDSGDAQAPDQLRMAVHEGFHVRRGGGLADGRGDVQRIEIAGIDEAIDGAQVDVIGIHVVGMFPAEFTDGRIGGGPHAGRFGTDDEVLAIRFVPDGDHGDAGLPGHDASCQLRLGLMGEAVSHSNRELL